jgi:hypothetical protein
MDSDTHEEPIERYWPRSAAKYGWFSVGILRHWQVGRFCFPFTNESGCGGVLSRGDSEVFKVTGEFKYKSFKITVTHELKTDQRWTYQSGACEWCAPVVCFPDAKLEIWEWFNWVTGSVEEERVFDPGAKTSQIWPNCVPNEVGCGCVHRAAPVPTPPLPVDSTEPRVGPNETTPSIGTPAKLPRVKTVVVTPRGLSVPSELRKDRPGTDRLSIAALVMERAAYDVRDDEPGTRVLMVEKDAGENETIVSPFRPTRAVAMTSTHLVGGRRYLLTDGNGKGTVFAVGSKIEQPRATVDLFDVSSDIPILVRSIEADCRSGEYATTIAADFVAESANLLRLRLFDQATDEIVGEDQVPLQVWGDLRDEVARSRADAQPGPSRAARSPRKRR